MNSKAPRVALIWANFGPYHMARARALASKCLLFPIEVAARQRQYGWRTERNGFQPAIRTLSPGALEDQSALRLAAAVYRTLEGCQPDVVMVPGWRELWSVSAVLWVRLHRRRAILMSESTFEDRPRSRCKEWLKSQLVRRLAEAASVGGTRHAAYLERLGIDRNQIALGYDSVDNEFFAARTDELRRSGAAADFGLPPAYFLYVGRLAPEKNLDRLLGAFRRYVSGGGDWSLVLVGDGPQAEQLRSHSVARASEGRVRFAGFKNGSALIPYYAFAGCLVLPSTSEPWGLVVNEAMASGLPVIVSSRCGCSPELVEHGSNGYVFDPADEEALAELMRRVATETEAVRTAMGRRSSEIIANYTPERWASEVMRLVEQIVPAACTSQRD